MSIVTSASRTSVSRGYDYYKRNYVNSVKQLNDYEFEGYVEGSLDHPYYVKIDINHPRNSYCECPHANGNIICKHMVALYFSVFPDEAEEYNSWLNSGYDDYDDYDEDDDEYEYDDHSYNSYFDKPLFFDEVLENYVNALSTEELKQVLRIELTNNEKRAYELYLKNNYEMYLTQNRNSFVFLNNLNKKVKDIIQIYDFNYHDFTQHIFTSKEIKQIKELYLDDSLQEQIDEIVFIPQLATYNDFQNLVSFYKQNNAKIKVEEFCIQLENYLSQLKHYSIKNSIPKSNILIAIYLLSDFTTKELAQTLFDNAKYTEYIDYIFENHNHYKSLFDEFKNILEKNFLKNRHSLPYVLLKFIPASHYQDKSIYQVYYLYSFLCLEDSSYLRGLEEYLPKNECIYLIESKTKSVFLLIKLYIHFDMDDKLWNLLYNDNNKYLLLNYIELLKEKHNLELYNYFVEQFYSTLKIVKNRENYRKAAQYMKAISHLNGGEELVNNVLIELRKSEYQKCIALFDEIMKAVR